MDESDFSEVRELLLILPRRTDVEKIQHYLNNNLEEYRDDNK